MVETNSRSKHSNRGGIPAQWNFEPLRHLKRKIEKNSQFEDEASKAHVLSYLKQTQDKTGEDIRRQGSGLTLVVAYAKMVEHLPYVLAESGTSEENEYHKSEYIRWSGEFNKALRTGAFSGGGDKKHGDRKKTRFHTPPRPQAPSERADFGDRNGSESDHD